MYNYKWTIDRNVGSILSSDIINPVTVKFNQQGQGTIVVTATAGVLSQTRSCNIPVFGTQPDFYMIAGPSVRSSFLAGNTSETRPDITIEVLPLNEFSGEVTLSVGSIKLNGTSVSPSLLGYAPTFLPDDKPGKDSDGNYRKTTLKLTLTKKGNLRSDVYDIEINGSSGGLSKSATVRLNIDAPDVGFIEI